MVCLIGSSIWGITLEGREFAIIGQADGAAFAEVVGKGWWNYVPYIGKKEGTLDYIGRLPQHSVPIIWREIKTYKHYAIIGSEAVGHGIQIFDLRKVGIRSVFVCFNSTHSLCSSSRLGLGGTGCRRQQRHSIS